VKPTLNRDDCRAFDQSKPIENLRQNRLLLGREGGDQGGGFPQ
jgi:hypothetical protein